MRIAASKKLLALGTLVAFSFLVLFSDYGFAQGETPLDRAQDLLSQGKYDDAVKMLDGYIGEIQAKPEQKPVLAAAWYLLANVYFEVGDDAKCDEALLNVFNAHPGFDRTEPNFGFRERVLKAKSQLAGKVPVAAETTAQPAAPQKETETKVPKTEPLPTKAETKTIGQQPKVEPQTVEMPNKKPVAVVKKKKKFPWLLVILGVGVVVVLIVLLTKKKKLTLKVTVGEGVTGNPVAGSYTYNKGDSVSYSYSLSSNSYKDLAVLLDGSKVDANGTVAMNSNHTLSVSTAKREATFINGVLTVSGVRYELASIPAGTFQMGSNSSKAYSNEQPVHTVLISKAFWMGKTEVTQGLWKAVMGSNPSYFKSGDTYPVETVSWDDCQSFITKLNQMAGGNYFRLPTEAEWEYACRAGTTDDRYGNIDSIAWYSSNSGGTTHPVGQKQANGWGLYDTLGNVWEWCQDWYGTYSSGYQTDPTGPGSGAGRVFRGGNWFNNAQYVRCTYRYGYAPGVHYSNFGFRLARTN